mgnify:FL=1
MIRFLRAYWVPLAYPLLMLSSLGLQQHFSPMHHRATIGFWFGFIPWLMGSALFLLQGVFALREMGAKDLVAKLNPLSFLFVFFSMLSITLAPLELRSSATLPPWLWAGHFAAFICVAAATRYRRRREQR